MRPPIVLIAVLIGKEVILRLGFIAAPDFAQGFIIPSNGIGQDEACAMRPNTFFALCTRIFGYNQLDFAAED